MITEFTPLEFREYVENMNFFHSPQPSKSEKRIEKIGNTSFPFRIVIVIAIAI